MGSAAGITGEQLEAVAEPGPITGSIFDARTSTALRYADAMTSGDVSNELFSELTGHFGEDEIVELTACIAWENSSARFNRALRIPSQKLWGDSSTPGTSGDVD